MQVCVIGTGHVGLATCASLAGAGHDVVLIANGPVAGAHLLERP